MPQIPGLGLDQSQLADVINQQYKGYSQKQRNQMMQSAAATPDNWSSITQQANATATQPTEFLGAGRTSNIPTVSQNGQQLTGYDSSNLSSLYNMNPNYQEVDFDYTDSAGKGYFSQDTQNRIESSAPNFVSGSKTGFDLNPTQAGGYYFSDPWGFSHSLDKVNNNKYFVSGDTLNQHTRSGTADTFYGLDTSKDLSGLSYGVNNGKEGLFFDPTKTNLSSLLTPQRNNAAYAEKKSGGFLGGLNNLAENIAKWTDPGFYHAMGGGTDNSFWKDATNQGIYSAVFNKMDPILDKLDPGHNWTQNQIVKLTGADSQKEAFNQIAPIVLAAVTYGVGSGASAGAAAAGEGAGEGALAAGAGEAAGAGAAASGAGAAAGGTGLNTVGQILNGISTGNAINSGDWLGAASGALNASSINPSSSMTKYLKEAGVNPTAARMLSGFGTSAAGNLIRGQDAQSALASALFSTASGEAGNQLSNMLNLTLGEIGSKAMGGAASGGINSLFNKNSPVAGSLYGAMSGGLHGFLNSTDRSNNTFNEQRDYQNKRQAQNITKLAKIFTKK